MEDITFVNFLIGTVIPLLVAVVTKEVASRKVKAWANAILSGVAGALTVIVQMGTDDIEAIVIGGFVTFITAIATYYGFAKPTGTTPAIQRSTAEFGIK